MKKKLLWVDDDSPERFRYELRVLKHAGWAVTWARTLLQGAQRLSQEAYDALIVDQTMPVDDGDMPDVWSGYKLVRWLQKSDIKAITLRPKLENQNARMIYLAAFYDENVNRELETLAPKPATFVKPADIDHIKALLEGKP